jgi:hypothetical protein
MGSRLKTSWSNSCCRARVIHVICGKESLMTHGQRGAWLWPAIDLNA